MEEKKYNYPALTADLALIAENAAGRRHALLIRRKNPPFKDCWALPGGFMETNETLRACAVREFHEETGIRIEEKKAIMERIGRSPDAGDAVVLALLERRGLNGLDLGRIFNSMGE